MAKGKFLYTCIRGITLLCSMECIVAQAQSQRTFDTSMVVTDFVSRHALWEDAQGRRPGPKETIYVPMLDIYSPSGVLIYHGSVNDTGRAAQVLASLPKIATPPPSPDLQMSLNDMLEITPELAKVKKEILDSHHFVVISISVQGKNLIKTSPYYVQNHAVDSIPKRPGVDIDVIHLNLIFPKN